MITTTESPTHPRLAAGLVATVVFITAIAPLATDIYVPGFPAVGDDLSAPATAVQLTLTTFFVGMALGQLVGGPVSDRHGRRTPLIAAVVAMTLASVACALSPTIAVLAAARLIQGFAGGWAMVIGRSVIIDLARGAQLVRVLNLIAAIGGIGPVVGPLLGAIILQLSGWRMSFWAVAALGVAMTFCAVLVVPETLAKNRRHGGGLRTFLHISRGLLRHRPYIGYVLTSGASMGAVFAYVATSAFILQSMNGLSPLAYSFDFAANAVLLAISSAVAARLAGRVATRKVILTGQIGLVTAGIMMLVGAIWFDTPLLLAIVAFAVLQSSQGLIGANGGALAAAEAPDHPGTGSALLGFVQWVIAGLAAPIAGLGGENTAIPMSIIIICAAATSMTGLLVIARTRPVAN